MVFIVQQKSLQVIATKCIKYIKSQFGMEGIILLQPPVMGRDAFCSEP